MQNHCFLLLYIHVISGVFYYLLGNIRPIFRSTLQSVQLVAVAKAADIHSYGFEALLQPFVEQLKLLSEVIYIGIVVCIIYYYYNNSVQDEGYQLQLQNEELTLHGAVVCFCGDTPASNFVGGFKEGVGFSFRKCRQCLITREDIAKHVRNTQTLESCVFILSNYCLYVHMHTAQC